MVGINVRRGGGGRNVSSARREGGCADWGPAALLWHNAIDSALIQLLLLLLMFVLMMLLMMMQVLVEVLRLRLCGGRPNDPTAVDAPRVSMLMRVDGIIGPSTPSSSSSLYPRRKRKRIAIVASGPPRRGDLILALAEIWVTLKNINLRKRLEGAR